VDADVFFVVHAWHDAHGFHATVRDVTREHADVFDDPDALARHLAALLMRPPATTTGGDT
jgi:hypothetical protein